MKKLILLLILSQSVKSQTIVIDSILPGTIASTITGVYITTPWYVSYGTYVKVYMHPTGTWLPSQGVALDCNGVIQKTGTYQSLSDSGFVWTIKINYCSSTADFFIPIGISSSTVYYQTHKCLVADVPELSMPLIKRSEYYNVLGQPIEKPEGVTIEVDYYSDGSIKKRKIFN